MNGDVRTERLPGGVMYQYCRVCDRMTVLHGDLCTVCDGRRSRTKHPIELVELVKNDAADELIVLYRVVGNI